MTTPSIDDSYLTNEAHNAFAEILVIPDVEENIPLPKGAMTAISALSTAEELQMRANTIKLISDLANMDIEPTNEDVADAESLAKQMVENPALKPDYAQYSNETLAYLAGMVGRMNASIVEDLAELKMYVVNKLVYEAENAKDSKTRITALAKLGEIDGVDAFKKRSEVTVKQQSMEEVENELLKTLEGLKSRIIDVEGEVIEQKSLPTTESLPDNGLPTA